MSRSSGDFKIMLPISAVIFTKNESLNIEGCIKSLQDFSEIVVVDSLSEDNTKFLALSLQAKVVDFLWNKNYPKKRQWTLENINFENEWILFVDADERVNRDFVKELETFIYSESDNYSAATIPIQYFFAGEELKHGQIPRKIVLLRVGHAKYPVVDDLDSLGMGELEGHYQPLIDGKTRKFKATISHNDNDSISTWMNRHVNYANWEAFLLRNRSVKSQVDGLKGGMSREFHKLPFRPVMFFVYSYFFRLGFLDGRAGFDYAFAKAWYYWLSGVIAREGK